MGSRERVTRVFESADRIPIDDASKLILMSDCHRGDGSQADEFFGNENLYLSALNHYYNEGYTYIEIGDGDELWENRNPSVIINAHPDSFRILKKFYQENRLYFIYGNHDMVKRNAQYVKDNLYQYYDKQEGAVLPLFEHVNIHEGLVLNYQSGLTQTQGTRQGGLPQAQGKQILLIHGHQVDCLNSRLWKLARFLVRYFWKPLELFGINNPTSPAQNPEKKETVGKRLTEWVIRENQMLIAGHNHRPMFPQAGEPLYFNDGSCVSPLLITGIEISGGGISLIKWSIKVREEGLLYVGRDVIAGPRPFRDLFAEKRIFSSCTLKDPSV